MSDSFSVQLVGGQHHGEMVVLPSDHTSVMMPDTMPRKIAEFAESETVVSLSQADQRYCDTGYRTRVAGHVRRVFVYVKG